MKSFNLWGMAGMAITVFGAAQAEDFECILEPQMVADLGSAVPGVLETVAVDRGDFVEEGQVVAKFESDVEWAAVEVAKARFNAMAQVESAEIRIDFSERKQKRQLELAAQDYVSEFNLDEAATEKALAEKALLEATESKQLAEAELKRARAYLQQKSIRSPFSGVVVDRFHNPGERVDEKPILEVAKIDPLYVEVLLPISMLNQIETGMQGSVATEYSPDENLIATVSVVDHLVDAASGLFGVRLILPNPENRIRAGLECRVEFLPVRSEAFTCENDGNRGTQGRCGTDFRKRPMQDIPEQLLSQD
jgi:RND family efflux transporter MFP subunit